MLAISSLPALTEMGFAEEPLARVRTAGNELRRASRRWTTPP
jgi:hypothetical protein